MTRCWWQCTRNARLCRCARRLRHLFSGGRSASVFAERFTEGRTARQWLRHLYEPTRRALSEGGAEAPDFDEFWEAGEGGFADLAVGRRDRAGVPPRTGGSAPARRPAVRIRIASASSRGVRLRELPGHRLGCLLGAPDSRFSIRSSSPSTATRLHSQSISAPPASTRRSTAASRSVSIRKTPRCEASATATSSGSTTTAACPRWAGAERGIALRCRPALDRRLV